MAIMSEWGEALDLKKPLQEYPRMWLQRDSYTNLNGTWEYQIIKEDEPIDSERWKTIIVPFSPGCTLSSTDEILRPGYVLWYRKQFAYKPSNLHTWLHFEAVDQKCTVFVNGIEVGSHEGGYCPFGFDISSMIKYQNSLMLRVTDDSDTGRFAYGKQKIDHGGMWYTPSSGIWQTVWLEDVSDHAVMDLKITPDLDGRQVHFDLAGDFTQAAITVGAAGKVIHRGLTNDKHYTAPIENVHPWTPDDPFLYDVYIQTEDDVIKSYFGMRKFSRGNDAKGIARFCLNNQPLFLTGLLDQGYTVDGRMTFPSDEAMRTEIVKIKEMGFNMLRKHVKVECRRWYYLCDKLGMLVMQDMPSGGAYYYNEMTLLPTLGIKKRNDNENPRMGRSEAIEKQIYYAELDAMLDALYNSTSIFAWVPFNEGWGQFSSLRVTEHIRRYDNTRLIDHASGWFDQGGGDFNSIHNYFFPYRAHPDRNGRIVLLSEFGGYSYIEWGHCEASKLYGYRKFKDKLVLDEAIRSLYEKMVLRNIPYGLSGCIYTQVSDIEDECNGLFTADRKIIKVDVRKMRKLNERMKRRLAR